MSRKPQLTDLPVDVLVEEIIEYLDPATIQQISRINSYFRSLKPELKAKYLQKGGELMRKYGMPRVTGVPNFRLINFFINSILAKDEKAFDFFLSMAKNLPGDQKIFIYQQVKNYLRYNFVLMADRLDFIEKMNQVLIRKLYSPPRAGSPRSPRSPRKARSPRSPRN